jgi:hypothetical protein
MPIRVDDAGLLCGDRRERAGCQHDADRDPPVVQVPGRNQAAVAVAAGPGKHDDRPRREQQLPEIGQVPPGVLHHPREIDAEVPGHGPVDLPHLRGARRRSWLSGCQREH